MTTQLQAEQAIFEVARKISTGEAREAYLLQVCGSDAVLNDRVQLLLRSYEQTNGLLGFPPAGLRVPPTVELPTAERPGATIGPYKLLQVIGEGGMGVVYMAEQFEPVERRVALKIIKPGMDSRHVLARFDAERQALSLMDHPNIAQVLDAGTTEFGRPYFVMELVKGVSITKYCDERRLAVKERLELMIPVCQAIQHAHQKGIIHRDIKPTNVLVAQYDGHPVPKVIDFGIAKAIDQRLTEQTLFTALGQVVGTLEYMPPEQAELNQLDIDTRSDIYSLGALLYELLTGSTPFDKHELRAVGFQEMLRIVREQDPPKPSTRTSSADALPSIAANRSIEPARLNKTIRGELDWIVMKALEKDRARRYETASSLALDLGRYLSGDSVQACPPSASYRFGKFARRNRVALTTAALIALALTAGTAVSTWQAVRATRAEARALGQEQKATAGAAAETTQRLLAEEQTLVVEGQRQLLENNERVNALVTDQILSIFKEIPVPAAKQQALLATVLSGLGDLDPVDRVKAFHSAGNQFVSMNDYPAALSAYAAGLALHPRHAGIYVSRGDTYFRQKDFEQAASDYTSALENRRDKDPANFHVPYARRGLAFSQLNEFEKAMADFRNSYEESPKPTLERLGQSYAGLGAYLNIRFAEPVQDGVVALFDRYVEDQKRSTDARVFAADWLAELKQSAAARRHLEAAQAERIGWGVHYRLGLLALQRGDQADYRRACQALLAKAAASPAEKVPQVWVYTALTCSLAPGALDDYRAVLDIARRALTQHPGSAQCRYVLGGILFRAGQFDEAGQLLHASLEATEDSQGERSYAPYYLAMTYHHLGRPMEAAKFLQHGHTQGAQYYNWRFQQIRQMLRREATQLIEPDPAN